MIERQGRSSRSVERRGRSRQSFHRQSFNLVVMILPPLGLPSSSNRPAASLSKSRCTYARELVAAVTALGNSAALLDVQKTELATGRLDDASPVGLGVVAATRVSPKFPPTQRIPRNYISNSRGSRSLHSRVATAVGDTVVRHLGGICWVGGCRWRISREERGISKLGGKLCVGGKSIGAAGLANQRA